MVRGPVTDSIDGTLIRGADGALYFIPDDALETYRVPENNAKQAREAIDQQNEVQGFALTSLSAGVSLLPALNGSLGVRREEDQPTEVQISSLRGLRDS